MKYLKDYREGDRVDTIYLCKFKQSAMTKNGKPYETVILQDKTGTLDAKIWNPNDAGIDEFEILDFIYVSGEIVSFQGAYQVNVKRINHFTSHYNMAQKISLIRIIICRKRGNLFCLSDVMAHCRCQK